MTVPTAKELYEKMMRMSIDERLCFFSLSLTEIHRELQDNIVQLYSMRRALEESEQNHASWLKQPKMQ